MQVCATNRFPVPNILSPFLGDYGALVIRAGGKWYVWTGVEWHPQKDGMSAPTFQKQVGSRPPCNVDDGWAGIIPAPNYQQNWSKKDLVAAFKLFMLAHQHEYVKPDGQCFTPLVAGRRIKREQLRRRVEQEGLVFRAPAPVIKHMVEGNSRECVNR